MNPDMSRSKISKFLLTLSKFKRLRKNAFRAALHLEKGQFFSLTARDILFEHYSVRVGAYSYGECMKLGAFRPGIVVGRYVSMANGIRVFNRNHPLKWLSMHPFFYNSSLGFIKEDAIPRGLCNIGHDVWIGERVIITAGCTEVGNGAVIGAGAVVTKNIPDFAVVAGVPARIIKYRFTAEMRAVINHSRWWERPITEITEFMSHMQSDLSVCPSQHPLLQADSLAYYR